MSAKSACIWKGLKDAVEALPEPELMDSAVADPDDVDISESIAILGETRADACNMPEYLPRYPGWCMRHDRAAHTPLSFLAAHACMHPVLTCTACAVPMPASCVGVFLHKKPEKVGREKKRFFQLEPAEDGGSSSCRLCYYIDAKQGVAVDLKGAVALNSATKIELKGGVGYILITNDTRTFQLIAKNDTEAHWWKAMFEKAKEGLVTERVYCPLELPSSDAETIKAVMALTEGEVTDFVNAASLASRTTPDDDDDGNLVASAVKRASLVLPAEDEDEDDDALPTLPAGDEIDEKHAVIQEYKCEEGEGTLDVKIGDVVTIEEKGSEGWWYAVLNPSNQGWMPASMCNEFPIGHKGAKPASGNPFPKVAATDQQADQADDTGM